MSPEERLMLGRRLTESSPKEFKKLETDVQSEAEKLRGRVWWPKNSSDRSCASLTDFSIEHTAAAAACESSECDRTA